MVKKLAIMVISISIFIVFFFSDTIAGKRIHHEKHYQRKHCVGKTEVYMPDGTRCDCVTATHAIEYDFANKWYEAIGQSLNYAFQTDKRAGIVIIVERPKDRKYFIRLNSIIDFYQLPIDVWSVETL